MGVQLKVGWEPFLAVSQRHSYCHSHPFFGHHSHHDHEKLEEDQNDKRLTTVTTSHLSGISLNSFLKVIIDHLYLNY